MASSSAATARPASAARASGSAQNISATRNDSALRSTPRKWPANRTRAEAAMAMQSLALFVLVALAAGGLIWVFVYPILSGERKAERRQESIVRSEPVRVAAAARSQPKVRRDIEETLKELEVRQKQQKNLPLA